MYHYHHYPHVNKWNLEMQNISSLGLRLELLGLEFGVFYFNGRLSDSKFREYFLK
jgi:hypothetical protein